MTRKPRKYKLHADLDALLDLLPPEGSELAEASEDDLWIAVKHFRSLWVELLLTTPLLEPKRSSALTAPQFSRLMLTIGGTYDYAVHRLLSLETRNDNRTVAGFSLPTLRRLTDRASEITDGLEGEEISPNESLQLSGLYLAHEYGVYLLAAELLSMPANWLLSPGFVSFFDHQLLHGLAALSKRNGPERTDVNELVRRLLRSALSQATRIAADREAAVNAKHKPGSFSLVRPQELGPIAARESAMIRRYGEKALESILEQQIALVFQSFGFLVIPTQRGKRSVDLLCLSNDHRVNRLFMIEAKTTKGFYSLPAKDDRALREYVESVRTSLRTLPDPSLLLVVAPKAASTLEKKLDALSDAIRLPVRFIPAEILGEVREGVPGAIPSDLLLDSIIDESTLVSSEFPRKISTRLDELQQVHRRLAKDLEAAWTKEPDES